MASRDYRNPPVFEMNMSYEDWKLEIGMWRQVTSLKPAQQGCAVALSLTGQSRNKARELGEGKLGGDDGVDVLLKELDAMFLRDSNDLAYEAFVNFDSYRKQPGINMNEFIMEYERRYGICKRHKMTLPEPVLSFKLLDSCSLEGKDKKLVLTAATDRNYDTMKGALRRIFGNSPQTDEQFGDIKIKDEPTYFTSGGKFRKQFTSMGKPSNIQKPGSFVRRGTNPIDKNGRRSRCILCQSTFHWMKNCPHKDEHVRMIEQEEQYSDPSDDEVCNLVLFTEEHGDILMVESSGCAIIDTACTRTVCGKSWLLDFIQNGGYITKSTPSGRFFRFGDGKRVKSTEKVLLPMTVGKTDCTIEADVVPADIPLLLSKASLKRANTVLDMKRDQMTMFGQPVEVMFTSSGHYCFEVQQKKYDKFCDKYSEILLLEDKEGKDLRKIMEKLHAQFGHPTVDRLSKLMKDAGIDKKSAYDLLPEVVASCDICARFKRPASKPAVGLPLATDFNQVVAVDLHELDKSVYYLHIMDEYTRYSAGAIITNKRCKTFIEKFIEVWIAVHGPPKKLFSDNGGEFTGHEVIEMSENFNIELLTTASYSPWSNGTLERHNQTLTTILLKVKAEQGCSWNIALAWALMAKNSLSSVHGFSAHQLVYGRNPNLPSVLTDTPPALEGTTSSISVGKHISSLHAARRAFTQAESAERIRRAIRKQIRTVPDEYESGNKVYYKRPDSQEWKGPGTIVGKDLPLVFVRHGGTLVRVHISRLRKVNHPERKLRESSDKSQINNEQQIEASYDTDPTTDQTSHDGDHSVHSDDQIEHSGDQGIDKNVSHSDHETDHHVNIDTGDCYDIMDINKLCVNNIVQYNNETNGDKVVAKVISRAGKTKGRNKYWFNLRCLEPSEMEGAEMSVDLSQVSELKQLVENKRHLDRPEESEDTVLSIEDVSWQEAKQMELESWRSNRVYEEVDDKGQKCVSVRWVCSLKDGDNGMIKKARLVARGFEEEKGDIKCDSPTCSQSSLKLALAIFGIHRWTPRTLDIKTAFLQGEAIGRNVYIRPPREVDSRGKLWHLKKCVYGLCDASMKWYQQVKSVIGNLGGQTSKLDPSVFFWKENGQLIGVLACHVDDFLWGGVDIFEDKVISKIRDRMTVGREEQSPFKYVGLQIETCGEDICLHQNDYIKNLTPIVLDKSRAQQKKTALNKDEKSELRSKIGQVMWAARQTRPDVLFNGCDLSSKVNSATVENILDINKCVKNILHCGTVNF